MGVGLIISAWVARYLGPEQFGALNFAFAFVALFGAIASLGLDGIVVRDIVREPERKFEIISSAFILKLCGGCLAFIISLAAITLMRPSESQAHLLVGIIAAGMIFQSFDAIDLLFQSQLQSKYTVIAKSAAFMVLSVVKMTLILQKAPLAAFAWAAFAEIIVGTAGLACFYLQQQSFVALWCPKIDTALHLLKESWPAILSGLAIMIYMRIDQIMLAQISGDRAVGLYSAALRFSEIWYFIPSAVICSVMPSITESRLESEKKFLYRMQQLFNNLVKMAYAISIPMTFVSTYLVTLFYGQAYKEAGVILAIHIWSAIFVFIGVGMSPWLLNEGLLKYSLIQTALGAAVNVIMNFILIPLYGGVGAAIATVCAYGCAAFLLNALFKKTNPIFKIQCKALFLVK